MKNVPKLRFSGFSDEWEEKILKDISDVRDGTHDSPKYLQEGYPLVTSKNLGEHGKLNLDNINLISEEDYININKRSKVDIGDILFGMIGTIGNPVMVEREGFAIKNVALIKELDVLKNSFLIQLLNSSVISRQFYRENTGGTQKFIALGNIRNLNIQLPSKDEQEKIANFLTKVDKLIEKQDEKVSNLEQYKKGMMQKIFSQEIRFKKDDGGEYPEWTVKKLCEVANRFDYGMNSAAIEFDGENKYIRITDIDEKSNKYKKDNLVSPDGDLDDRYLVEENDILFARTGASVGKTYLYDKNDGKVYFAGFLIRVNVNKENNAKFIFMQTQTEEYRKWIEIMSMRSGQPGVNSQEYSIFQVKVPCLEEQDKIANFLSKIDSIIEKEKEKLEELRVWKRGLLQQMFI